jgi:hypothetical protein
MPNVSNIIKNIESSKVVLLISKLLSKGKLLRYENTPVEIEVNEKYDGDLKKYIADNY